MTVCFNGLGNEGRLGNQMFQYAFMRGMSKKHSMQKWITRFIYLFLPEI